MQFRSCMISTAVWAACCVTSTAIEPTEGWSGFQNGGRLGAIDTGVATQWSPETNILWQADVEGYGQSTPVISDGQIYVTSVSGDQKNTFHLAAFGLDNGRKLWQRDFENPSPKENTPMTSRAAPTPVTTGDGCVAFFEGGVIASVAADGTVRWQRDLVAEYGPVDARHGLASSLEADEARVYAWIERSDAPYILALDRKSGENVWKIDGVGATTWASPRLIPTEWGSHLVCSASGRIVGIEPSSGRRLWEFTSIANNTSCTPIPAGQNRFLIGASDGRGEETSGAAAQFNGVIAISRGSDAFEAKFLWHAEKASSTFGSPVVAGDFACFVNRAGVLYLLDIETGARRAAIRTTAGGIWATPLVVENRLYLFGYKGTTSVISLDDEPSETASNRLWQASGDSSAFRGGNVLYAAAAAPPVLVLRRGDAIYAVKADTP